jgi:hypothetical protein
MLVKQLLVTKTLILDYVAHRWKSILGLLSDSPFFHENKLKRVQKTRQILFGLFQKAENEGNSVHQNLLSDRSIMAAKIDRKAWRRLHRANATSPRAAHCIANNPRTVQRSAAHCIASRAAQRTARMQPARAQRIASQTIRAPKTSPPRIARRARCFVAVFQSGISCHLVCAYKNSLYFKETTHGKQEGGKVGENVILYRAESVCCLLVLDSVTSTPQWIRQPKLRDIVHDVTQACYHS